MNTRVLLRILTLSLLAQALPSLALAQGKLWDRRFGGFSNDVPYGVVSATGGGFVIVGTSDSGIGGDRTQNSRGAYDMWTIKINETGEIQWDRRFGGNDDDYAFAVLAAPDGGFVMGGFSVSGANGDKTQTSWGGWDVWAVKIDANGNKVWDRRFGGTGNDAAFAMAASPDGSYVLAGVSDSFMSGDKTQDPRGTWDYWVVKIDANGNKVWDRRFGGTADDLSRAIVAAPGGGYVITGVSQSGASGDRTQGLRGTADIWVVKIDENGNKIWDRRFGGEGYDAAHAITTAPGGGYVIAGESSSGANGDKSQPSRGGIDAWFIKIDENGNKLWDQRYGGTGSDLVRALHRVPMGGVMAVGETESPVSGDVTGTPRGGVDTWLLRLSDHGSKLWDLRLGGNDNDFGRAVTQAPDGQFMVASDSFSGLSGDRSQGSRGLHDYWILKVGETQPGVQRMDASQPVTGFANNRWSFLTAWNLATGQFQSSPNWQNGTFTWEHASNQYYQWIARFTYDQPSGQTRSLAWYYRQIHVQ